MSYLRMWAAPASQQQNDRLITPPAASQVVSVGNVGQLAADLLISSLALHRKGALHHDALLPCLGNAAFSHAPGLTFGLELFCDPARKLACLQQRSPAAPGLQVELAQAMAAWIAQAGFKQVTPVRA
jgi:proteasome assembly chaperone 2